MQTYKVNAKRIRLNLCSSNEDIATAQPKSLFLMMCKRCSVVTVLLTYRLPLSSGTSRTRGLPRVIATVSSLCGLSTTGVGPLS